MPALRRQHLQRPRYSRSPQTDATKRDYRRLFFSIVINTRRRPNSIAKKGNHNSKHNVTRPLGNDVIFAWCRSSLLFGNISSGVVFIRLILLFGWRTCSIDRCTIAANVAKQTLGDSHLLGCENLLKIFFSSIATKWVRVVLHKSQKRRQLPCRPRSFQ